MNPTQFYFTPCPRGLEQLLANELEQLGASAVTPVPGGIKFEGNWKTCYRINLHTRLATRVLWKVGHSTYRHEDHIYKLAFSLPWETWFSPEQSIRVYVTAIHSPLKSLNFITLKIKDAICDRFVQKLGRRPSVNTEQPDIRIHAFLTQDSCTLYIDTSGEPLYKRGYKPAKAFAPLKENLAAGIILLSGWEPTQTFLDPMCGSGTFLLEAAMMAYHIAPGLNRNFAFEKLTTFAPEQWKSLTDEAKNSIDFSKQTSIVGSDIDPKMIEATRTNLQEAQLEQYITLQQTDILSLTAPSSQGILITNPPYGVRLGEQEELRAWYPKIGDQLKKNYAGWTCYFFSGDHDFPKYLRLKESKRIPLMNGKIDCRLFEFKIISGFNRREKNIPKSKPTE